MEDKTVIIGDVSYTVFSEYNGSTEFFGWHEAQDGKNNTGAMYNGKTYSVSRAKFSTYEKACDDLADHVSYYRGIRRNVTKEALK